MECEKPVWIHDPARPLIRDKYGTDLYRIKVSCGKCPACQSNHRKMWYFRLKVESNKCISSYVVTLTYNDKVVPDYEVYNNEFRYHPIRYSDIQDFHKRLRKRIGPFRFFAIAEYGSERLRPHYHICYFFDHPQNQTEFEDSVFASWFPDCRITIDTTNDRACNYILKYCLSMVDETVPDCFRPKLRCSTKPYIGSGFLDDLEVLRWLHVKKTDISNYLGYRQRLPRIYRDKVFSEDEKKFIAQELGRVQEERSKEKFFKVLEKELKYGGSKGSEYAFFAREEFNKKVRKIAKLKSIK